MNHLLAISRLPRSETSPNARFKVEGRHCHGGIVQAGQVQFIEMFRSTAQVVRSPGSSGGTGPWQVTTLALDPASGFGDAVYIT